MGQTGGLQRAAGDLLRIHHAGFAEKYASPDFDIARGWAVNVAPLDRLYRHGVIVFGEQTPGWGWTGGLRSADGQPTAEVVGTANS